MPLPREQVYTTDDIYALPDGERAELIDGQIYMMGTPSRIHQKLVGQLSRIIGNYIESNHGSCEIYPAPFAVFIKKDDKNYVEPDISVICDKNKLSDRDVKAHLISLLKLYHLPAVEWTTIKNVHCMQSLVSVNTGSLIRRSSVQ